MSQDTNRIHHRIGVTVVSHDVRHESTGLAIDSCDVRQESTSLACISGQESDAKTGQEPRAGNRARRTGGPSGRGKRTDAPPRPLPNSESYKPMSTPVPINKEAYSNGYTNGGNSNSKGSFPVQKAAPKVAARPTGVQTDAFERKYNIQVADSGRYEDYFLQITYTNCPSAAEAFVRDHCEGCTEFGFDLEHKPTYRPGQKPNVSLLQFAPVLPEHVRADDAHIPILVYSIYHDSGKIPGSLCDILANSAIAKYGVGIKGDLRHLSFMNLSQPVRESYKELGPLAHKVGLMDKPGIGLKALVERCLGIECTTYKTKKLTMTNWEMNSFREAEIKYAAMDAWTAIECLSVIKYVDSTDPDGPVLS